MAIQQQFISKPFAETLSNTPARVIKHSPAINHVVIVLSEKADEALLPKAMQHARTHHSELMIVHAFGKQTTSYAGRYLKSVHNKAKAQYADVSAYQHQGTDVVQAIADVTNGMQNVLVLLPQENRNWIQKLGRASVAHSVRNSQNLTVEEIAI